MAVGLRSPVIRLSIGLTLLTCSVLLLADLLGLVPRSADQTIQERLAASESIATRAAAAVSQQDLGAVRSTLADALRRRSDLLSAGLRASDGRLLVEQGDHRGRWAPIETEGSTPNHVRIPLYRDGKPWATLEMRFADPRRADLFDRVWSDSFVRLLVVVAALGFAAYTFYLRRSLRHLDPSAVIPARVQATLDVMAEGVVLIDRDERIVLANDAFASGLGRAPQSLLGASLGQLPWRDESGGVAPAALPWSAVIRESQASTGVTLRLAAPDRPQRVFSVNAAPVLDGWGHAKGVIATFDDVTLLQEKTAQLEEALTEIEKSRDEIRLQNDELRVLSRRDPLTGVANRRAFREQGEAIFASARASGAEFACIMADIDHFKSINDQHGHAVGDEVIRRVAEALVHETGSPDLVCRYGGEEFCCALPGAPLDVALATAERIRRAIAQPAFTRVPLTVSFGVATIRSGADQLNALVEQADQALYAAKTGGRNRVERWQAPPDGARSPA
jgi:diguanylate cyclase (GGDEF)-like protein